MAHVRNSGARGGEGPCISQKRQQQSNLCCPGVLLGRDHHTTLLKHSLPLSLAAQQHNSQVWPHCCDHCCALTLTLVAKLSTR